MQVTNINKKIMSIETEKAMYDNACKNVLKDKQIMARILKECVTEFADCDIKDIIQYAFSGELYVGSYPVDSNTVLSELATADTEDNALDEGMIKYDIRFNVSVPHSNEQIALIINVEAQNDHYLHYELVTRAIYYCSRMISSQKESVFSNDDYHKIRKVYSIWLCMNPPNKEKNSITQYDITEKTIQGCVTRPKKSFDLLSVIMIYLGEAYRSEYDGIIALLSTLLSKEMPQYEKRDVLEGKFGIHMTKVLERGVTGMCNLSKGVVQSTMLDSISNIMNNLGLTFEQAMNALGISDDEKPEYEYLMKESKELSE